MLHFDFHFFAVFAANSHNAGLPFCECAGVYLCFSLFLVFLSLSVCVALFVPLIMFSSTMSFWILLCVMCTNVLFNYDYMMERRRQPNFLIAIVLECRRVYVCVHEAADSRKTIHSIWSEFETIISLCKRTRIFRCVCFRLFVAICATALTSSYCLSMDGASISFENRMNDYKLAITYLFVIFCFCCKLTYSLEQSAHLLVSISSSSPSSSWSRIDAISTLTHSLTLPLENSISCILCAQTSFNS